MARFSIVAALVGMVLSVAPARAPAQAMPASSPAIQLTDAELAQNTGKFLLPNGIELALSVTSDTIVNGQIVLRTVLTVDQSSRLQVFGRSASAAPLPTTAVGAVATATGLRATGVSVSVDRQSGIATVTPTFASVATTSVGTAAPNNADLVALPLVAGAPGIQTPDGVVSLAAVRGSQQVSLAGDRFGVVNLVGQSIATALVNSADNRTLSSVTNVDINLRNALPYAMASGALRAEALAIDATTRGILR